MAAKKLLLPEPLAPTAQEGRRRPKSVSEGRDSGEGGLCHRTGSARERKAGSLTDHIVAGAEWRRLELISVNTKALDYHSLNDRHFSDCVCGGFAFALLLERDRGRFAFHDTLVSTDRLFARPPRFSVVSCVSACGSAMTFRMSTV